jgi:hypothetical protein
MRLNIETVIRSTSDYISLRKHIVRGEWRVSGSFANIVVDGGRRPS